MLHMMRGPLILAMVIFSGCQSNIYLRDGVTDGDTFFLAPVAYASDDPAVASWVRYSLMLSTCQLQMGGGNPSRNSSFECELKARQHLVEAWYEHRERHSQADAYLDALATVDAAGFLAEYTVHYLQKAGWNPPLELATDDFLRWSRNQLSGHRPQTRLIGYWGYRPVPDSLR